VSTGISATPTGANLTRMPAARSSLLEELTHVEQKVGLSHNLLARLTDKRGRRFAETLCKEKARPKPGFWLVTPTMRSWNQFSALIEEWDELRRAA